MSSKISKRISIETTDKRELGDLMAQLESAVNEAGDDKAVQIIAEVSYYPVEDQEQVNTKQL